MYSSELHSVHLSFPSVSRLMSSNLIKSRVLLEGTLVGQPTDQHQVRNGINSLALTSIYRGGRRGDDPVIQTLGPGTTVNYFLELDSKIQWSES